jgi:hypothetical protein
MGSFNIVQKYCLWSDMNILLPGNPKREGSNEYERVQCLIWSNSRLYNVPTEIGSTGFERGRRKTFVEGGAWFGSVTCVAELVLRHYHGVLQIKTNSSLFQKAYIETALENAPSGCKIVLSVSHKGIPFIAISHRYSTQVTLLFVKKMKALLDQESLTR